MLTDPNDPRHGTGVAYAHHKCRCTKCSDYWKARVKAQKAVRYAKGLAPDDPRHGTNNGYSNWNCRCEPCRKAHSEVAKYRAKKRTKTGAWNINDILPEDLLITQKTEIST